MITSIKIDKRFCGPPNSANGGYTAGLLAANLPFEAEITLRQPPPLEKEMTLIQDGEEAKLMDGEKLIAEAKASTLELIVPEAISYEEAEKAKEQGNSYQYSPLSNCFVCGSKRAVGDGLRIRPGDIGDHYVSTSWIPFEALGNEEGILPPEIIWSALDCPGAWAIQDDSEMHLLGRMAARSVAPVRVGEKYIISGWIIEQKGRKTLTGTAIYEAGGTLCAYAKATWIMVKSLG